MKNDTLRQFLLNSGYFFALYFLIFLLILIFLDIKSIVSVFILLLSDLLVFTLRYVAFFSGSIVFFLDSILLLLNQLIIVSTN
jgi:hypothetical protein